MKYLKRRAIFLADFILHNYYWFRIISLASEPCLKASDFWGITKRGILSVASKQSGVH